jgi:hypothetical protein
MILVNKRLGFVSGHDFEPCRQKRLNHGLSAPVAFSRWQRGSGYGNDSGSCDARHDPDHAEFREMRSRKWMNSQERLRAALS